VHLLNMDILAEEREKLEQAIENFKVELEVAKGY